MPVLHTTGLTAKLVFGRHGCNIPPVKWSLTAAPMGILVQAHGQVWVGLALLVDVGLL